MAPKLEWKDRILDVVICAVLGLLAFSGYYRASIASYLNRGPTAGFELPLLSFCSLIAIFYPFRIHTRVVWIFLAPVSIFVAPLFGAHAFHRLRFAPGLEQEIQIMELHIFSFVFVLFCIVWLVPSVFGWQLRRPGATTLGRSADLKELFVLTAIVCVLIILFRDAFSLESLASGPGTPSMWLLTTFALRQFVVYAICIWTGLAFHWSIFLLAVALGIGVESYFEWHAFSQIQSSGVAPRSFWNVAENRVWNVAVLVPLIAAVRIAGYRIQRINRNIEELWSRLSSPSTKEGAPNISERDEHA